MHTGGATHNLKIIVNGGDTVKEVLNNWKYYLLSLSKWRQKFISLIMTAP